MITRFPPQFGSFMSAAQGGGVKAFAPLQSALQSYSGPRTPGVVVDVGGWPGFFDPEGRFYTGDPNQLAAYHQEVFGDPQGGGTAVGGALSYAGPGRTAAAPSKLPWLLVGGVGLVGLYLLMR